LDQLLVWISLVLCGLWKIYWYGFGRETRTACKSVKDLMNDAKRDIAEEKAIQKIEWMKWEAWKSGGFHLLII
jgi:hypothetical protein